jgi:Uncharacterized protein conserved in bacteria (DUF2236).
VIRVGEGVFGTYGPSAITSLFCASLPDAYCAAKGANVLMETGRMANDFTRRITETAQFVIDVMDEGGLGPEGRGVRAAQKVRLMHAAIRHMVTTRRQWPEADLGVPINQEDLAGTLLTFSLVVLESVGRLGVTLTHEEKSSYLHAWRCAGHLLGIRPDMIPVDLDDARAQYAAIRRRQFRASEQGRILAGALVDTMDSWIPGHVFDGFVPVLIRHLCGDDVARMLAIPDPDWTEILLRFQQVQDHLFTDVAHHHTFIAAAVGRFNQVLIQTLDGVERKGKPVGFRIPDHLKAKWRPQEV